MIKAIITDIEGTTTSLSFVKDTLFPYARQHIAQYLRDHAHDSEVKQHIDAVKALLGHDADLESIIQQLITWIDQDQKITPLKALQGMVWENGYRSGHFTGHIYEDAFRKMKLWHGQGIKIFIYSSGSVFAQKLLYRYSDFGDLTPFLSGYFDTHIGQKRDIASYRNILNHINMAPQDVLFLSDITDELDAAAAAGLHTYWLVRDNGNTHANTKHRLVTSFDDITLDN